MLKGLGVVFIVGGLLGSDGLGFIVLGFVLLVFG